MILIEGDKIEKIVDGVEMHSKKVVINSIFGVLYKVVILVLGFATRKLFIMYMGEELLGLNSLFTDLLNFLNLADLGIGVSVQFTLYKPIAENDEDKIISIVNITKKIFEIIGISIVVGGLILTFFLQDLIADNPYSMSFLRVVFMLNVLSISMTYLVAHKKIFLQAKEEIYTINIVEIFTQILGMILKIISIVVLKNYYLFVGISIITVAISNFSIKRICDKKYTFLNKKKGYEAYDKVELLKSLKDVIPLKIGVFLYSSTDNIIISSFLGLKQVASYSNYMLITNAVMQFCYMIAEAFKVSFGNAIFEGTNKKKVEMYFSTYIFLQFLMSSFCTVCLWCLLDPFIKLIFGSKYVISVVCMGAIVIDFFIHSMYQPLSMLFGAMGKFKEDKVITLGIDVINIVLSIILVRKLGLLGPIIGTIASNLLTWVFRSYQIVYKEFNMNVHFFIKRIVTYFLCCAIEVSITVWICNILAVGEGLGSFAIRTIICIVTPNIINYLLWRKTEEFLYLKDKMKDLKKL